MDDKTTLKDFMACFDCHKVCKWENSDGTTKSVSVIVHPNMHGVSFIELSKESHDALKKDMAHKLLMAANGIDELDPVTKFAIMLLDGSW